jgi:hypothetical protein
VEPWPHCINAADAVKDHEPSVPLPVHRVPMRAAIPPATRSGVSRRLAAVSPRESDVYMAVVTPKPAPARGVDGFPFIGQVLLGGMS